MSPPLRTEPAIHVTSLRALAGPAASTIWFARNTRTALAKLRMGDLDKRLGALADGFSMQVGNSVFRDDVPYQSPRSHHAGTRRKHRSDAGNRAAFGCRRQGNDGLASLGTRCAAQKIHLAADAAVKVCADGIGAHLPGQIDLERRIDGHHVVIARDK